MATQPYPVATQPSPSAAQPVHAAAQPVHAAAQPVHAAAQPVHAAAQPVHAPAQPVRAARQPAADDDPLTSPAYSLRRQGSVDGHSRLPQAAARHSNGGPTGICPADGRPATARSAAARSAAARRPTWPGAAATIPARSWPGSGPDGTHGSAVVRPYAAQHYGEPTQCSALSRSARSAGPVCSPANSAGSADPAGSANTPPYGDAYGYGHQPAGPGRAVSPGDDPRRPDGQWGNGRPQATAPGAPIRTPRLPAGQRLWRARTTPGVTTAG